MTASAFRIVPVIRPMRADDVDHVVAIAAGLQNLPRWPRSAYLTALDPHATPARVALVVADSATNLPVAYAIAALVPSAAELETIAVSPFHQRQGLGGALIRALLQELRLLKISEIWLEVRPSNVTAIELYRRTGFAESGRRKSYYADPVEDALVMSLTIPTL